MPKAPGERFCGRDAYTNPERAESVRDLRRLLTGPTGKTILTTVHKFQEVKEPGDGTKRRAREEFPLLSSATNVFGLADEAHGGLTTNLRKALPNAAFFGFTGVDWKALPGWTKIDRTGSRPGPTRTSASTWSSSVGSAAWPARASDRCSPTLHVGGVTVQAGRGGLLVVARVLRPFGSL